MRYIITYTITRKSITRFATAAVFADNPAEAVESFKSAMPRAAVVRVNNGTDDHTPYTPPNQP